MAKMASLHQEMNQVIKLSESEWERAFEPITHTPIDIPSKMIPDTHVWTLVEVDGDLFIVNGYATINKIGYHITETPWKLDQYIEVRIND